MEIKAKILDKIKGIEDEQTLHEIYDWIESLVEAVREENFDKEEINAVQEGYAEYLSGKTISHHDAGKLFQKWLAEKDE